MMKETRKMMIAITKGCDRYVPGPTVYFAPLYNIERL